MSFTPLGSATARRALRISPFYLWAVLAVFLSSGCSSHYVSILSTVSPSVSIGSYSMRIHGVPQTPDRILEEQVKRVMKNALAERGYREAQVGIVSDIVVDVRFDRKLEPEDYRTVLDTLEPQPVRGGYRNTLHLFANLNDSRTGRRLPRPAWSVSVTGERQGDNPNTNLAKEVPVLLAAATEFIGKKSVGIQNRAMNSRSAEELLIGTK